MEDWLKYVLCLEPDKLESFFNYNKSTLVLILYRHYRWSFILIYSVHKCESIAS